MNKPLEYIVYIVAIFLSLLVYVIYCNGFGKCKIKNKFISWIIIVIMTAIGLYVLEVNGVKPLALFYLISGIVIACMYKMPLLKKLIGVVLIFILLLLLEMMVYVVLGNAFITFYVAGGIIAKIAICIIGKIYISKLDKNDGGLFKVTISDFTILPITTVVIMLYIFKAFDRMGEEYNYLLSILIIILLIYSNVITFYGFYYLSKEKEKEKLTEATAIRLQNEKQYYQDLYAKQRVEDKINHDLKHKIYALNELLITDTERAKVEISSLTKQLNEANSLKITGYVSVDTLINNKVFEAKESGIQLKIKSSIAKMEGVDAIDFCIIIGNILDNAIEATQKLDNANNKVIDFTLKQNGNLLVVQVKNFFNGQNNSNGSSKNSLRHGFGLNNVKEIATKYNGYVDIQIVGDVYNTNILLEVSSNVN